MEAKEPDVEVDELVTESTPDLDKQIEEIDEGIQSELPAEVKSICTEGSLCIVAFLHEAISRQERIAELGLLSGKWYGKNVKVYWLEAGQNADCEAELNLSEDKTTLIAFKPTE